MNTRWLLALLVLPFVKGCIFPGWSSAVELALCSMLVAFLSYFNPEEKLQASQMEEITKTKEDVAALREQLTGLKLKLGFRPER